MFVKFDKLSLREFFHKQVQEFEATDVPRNELTFIMFILSKLMQKDKKNFRKLYELLKKMRRKSRKI